MKQKSNQFSTWLNLFKPTVLKNKFSREQPPAVGNGYLQSHSMQCGGACCYCKSCCSYFYFYIISFRVCVHKAVSDMFMVFCLLYWSISGGYVDEKPEHSLLFTFCIDSFLMQIDLNLLNLVIPWLLIIAGI